LGSEELLSIVSDEPLAAGERQAGTLGCARLLLKQLPRLSFALHFLLFSGLVPLPCLLRFVLCRVARVLS
jgi:hypothetical protein